MIERHFVAQKLKEFQIEEYISTTLNGVEHSHTKMMRTPLGEKIVIHSSRPGLIVGRKGANIKALTKNLKKKFTLENPQIEINEVEDIFTNANIVAEKIKSSLERFGTQRFKGVMHKMLENVLKSGVLGVEIVLSGKIPSSRARTWRVLGGYLKKSGQVAVDEVDTAYHTACLKTGTVGIKVSIMPKDAKLPDKIIIQEVPEIQEDLKPKKKAAKTEDKKEEAAPESKEDVKEDSKVEEAKEEAPATEEKPVKEAKEEPKAEEKEAPAKEEAKKE